MSRVPVPTLNDAVWPSPGSGEALAYGCLCSPIANNFGRRPPRAPNRWWINAACPLHFPIEEIERF